MSVPTTLPARLTQLRETIAASRENSRQAFNSFAGGGNDPHTLVTDELRQSLQAMVLSNAREIMVPAGIPQKPSGKRNK